MQLIFCFRLADPFRKDAFLALARNLLPLDASSSSASTTSSRSTAQSRFRKALISADWKGAAQSSIDTESLPSGTARCFVLDKALPNVVAAHIVPRRASAHRNLIASIFGADFDIDSRRNGIMLYTSLEHAFDRGQICFFKESGAYVLHLLDPALSGVKLVEKARTVINAEKSRCSLKFVDVEDAEVQKLTFGDLDGKATLHLPDDFKVSDRALCFQAKLSTALMGDKVEFIEYWSDGFNRELMDRFLEDTLSAVGEESADAVGMRSAA